MDRPLLLFAALLLASAPPVISGSTPTPTRAPISSTRAPASPQPADTVDYQRLEREVLAELNSARANPSAYAANLTALLPLFNGNLIKRPGATISIRTTEGAAAVREAIDALKRQKPVPALTLAAGMSAAAADLANDQRRTGELGHIGGNGFDPDQRLNAHGSWLGGYSENIDYGPSLTGRDMIVNLIVDDGVPGRGHRENIFDGDMRMVGIACSPHPKLRSMCVIDHAEGYISR